MRTTGTVSNAATGEKILFATVYQSDAAGKPTGVNTTTDENGNYQLNFSAAPGYITARIVGMNAQTKPAASALNFQLTNKSNLPEVQVKSTRTYIIPIAVGLLILAALNSK